MNKTTRICPECVRRKENGECTFCGTLRYPQTREWTLNEFGHCPDCVQMESKYSLIDDSTKGSLCTECKKPLENIKHNLCNECLTKQDTCSFCGTNSKYLSEYACNKCKINFMKAEKTYKLPQ